MRFLVQRVKSASVVVEGEKISSIGPGLLTLVGIKKRDTEKELEKGISKILKLRVFEDADGKMNRSLADIQGEHLIVSQFTLYASLEQGNRPGFSEAASPAEAKILYEKALQLSQKLGVKTAGGQFQAHMEVSLINDGPVTLWLETGN